jgi:hypothetical protein
LSHSVAGDRGRDGLKIKPMQQWAISSQASVARQRKVQRPPNASLRDVSRAFGRQRLKVACRRQELWRKIWSDLTGKP